MIHVAHSIGPTGNLGKVVLAFALIFTVHTVVLQSTEVQDQSSFYCLCFTVCFTVCFTLCVLLSVFYCLCFTLCVLLSGFYCLGFIVWVLLSGFYCLGFTAEITYYSVIW